MYKLYLYFLYKMHHFDTNHKSHFVDRQCSFRPLYQLTTRLVWNTLYKMVLLDLILKMIFYKVKSVRTAPNAQYLMKNYRAR